MPSADRPQKRTYPGPPRPRGASRATAAARPARLRAVAASFAAAIICALCAGPVDAAADAAADPSDLCDAAAAEAARRTGVPLSVLSAIALTETGRKHAGSFRPWPWTVNMEGAGHWFDTPEAALNYVDQAHARGARSFDVGCFQINFKWHGAAFASFGQMFDPLANALYAAGFLGDLYAETGSWSLAAGAYHSRNAEFADRYRARFDRIRLSLGAAPDGPPGGPPGGTAAADTALPKVAGADGRTPWQTAARDIPEIPDIVAAANRGPGAGAARTPRANTFPLLQAGVSAGLGSLVPGDRTAGASLFAASAPAAVPRGPGIPEAAAD